ncbi:hypothetical protein SAMN04487948_10323 [Halogranum amylolyticum]|uniref:Spondin_N n=1 Tax=Halogranum amylolyticum TaxID=660520 RepID=A0A1H8QC19_9EURY|nr:hypothetical protein [Halogranum amylolyticum]SEO51606.1 hypothetical protein SAMN04487948_10323 [Halogranum amylolyticum]
MRHPLVVLCCVALLVLAGCTAPATDDPPTSDVRLSLDNADSQRYEVTVAVAPTTVDTLRIIGVDGETRTYRDVDSLDVVPSAVLGNATGFTASGPDVTTKRYVLEPGTGIGDELADTPQNTTVVYLVTQPDGADPTRSWGAATCGQSEFAEIAIRIADGGALSTATHCGSLAN